MKYKFSDLINIKKTQKLLDSFCDAVGVAAAIIDLDGKIFIGSRWQRICTNFHRINERTREKCIESDTQLANELQQGKRFSIYQCRNGLTDAASPIIIDGEHIANTFVGQFFLEKPNWEFFRRQAVTYGFDEADYLDALHIVPVIKKENLPAILDFLTNFAEMAAGMGLDHKKQIEAQKALLKSEEQYRLLADNITDNIWVLDIDTLRFTYVSPSVVRITGYSTAEIIGFHLRDVLTPSSMELATSLLAEELSVESRNTDKSRSRILEFEQYHKDGTTVWTEVSVRFLYDNEGRLTSILGVTRDIGERKRLQNQLQKAQKMESLGLLAGGVAHDLNNVLSGIVSYPDLILMDLPEDSRLRKPIEIMQESGKRAASIVQDLLTITRGVATVREPLSLNDLTRDYFNSPEFKSLEQIHPAVAIKTSLATDLFNISGSPVHISKVVMNLVANASEAIEGSGTVIILTVNRYVDRPLRGYEDVNTGEYAVLAVSDDGPGISSDDLMRIFEPFYTKKAMGRSGTGLGLAVVWNTVQDHKGYIDVASDENGTTFELYFPITRDAVTATDPSISIEDYKGNKESILVVDDVESQREISCRMLDVLGYKANAVSSGEEAVEHLQENSVDLVLLDMIMDPGINGRETYERIIKIHPGQKAVIISGYADTDEVKKTQEAGAGKYLKKPVTLEKLGLAVKEELEN